jgi:hypothetical protein
MACGAGVAGNVSGWRGVVLAACAVERAAGFAVFTDTAALVEAPFAGAAFDAGLSGFLAVAVLAAALVFATERGAFAALRAGALALAFFMMNSVVRF